MRRTSAQGLIAALLLISALLHPVVHAIAMPHSGVALSAPDHLRDCPCVHTPVVSAHAPQVVRSAASCAVVARSAATSPESNLPALLRSRAPPEQSLESLQLLFV